MITAIADGKAAPNKREVGAREGAESNQPQAEPTIRSLNLIAAASGTCLAELLAALFQLDPGSDVVRGTAETEEGSQTGAIASAAQQAAQGLGGPIDIPANNAGPTPEDGHRSA